MTKFMKNRINFSMEKCQNVTIKNLPQTLRKKPLHAFIIFNYVSITAWWVNLLVYLILQFYTVLAKYNVQNNEIKMKMGCDFYAVFFSCFLFAAFLSFLQNVNNKSNNNLCAMYFFFSRALNCHSCLISPMEN